MISRVKTLAPGSSRSNSRIVEALSSGTDFMCRGSGLPNQVQNKILFSARVTKFNRFALLAYTGSSFSKLTAQSDPRSPTEPPSTALINDLSAGLLHSYNQITTLFQIKLLSWALFK